MLILGGVRLATYLAVEGKIISYLLARLVDRFKLFELIRIPFFVGEPIEQRLNQASSAMVIPRTLDSLAAGRTGIRAFKPRNQAGT